MSAVALGFAACAASVNTSNDGGRDGSTTADGGGGGDTSTAVDASTTVDTGTTTVIDVTTPPTDTGTTTAVDTGTPSDTGAPDNGMCVPGRVTTPFVIIPDYCLRSSGARPVPPAPDAGPDAEVDAGPDAAADGGAEPPDVDTRTCALDCLLACEGGGGGAGDIAPGSTMCQRVSPTMGECITMRICR